MTGNKDQWIGKEVRVRFDLEIIEDGFPPIAVEYMLGILKEPNKVWLDNTPFFAEGVALNDTVKCGGNPPEMIYERVLSESGYKALSVIFIDESYEDKLFRDLQILGCWIEYGEFPNFNIMAIAVPPDLDYSRVTGLLQPLQQDGKISLAELCVYSRDVPILD